MMIPSVSDLNGVALIIDLIKNASKYEKVLKELKEETEKLHIESAKNSELQVKLNEDKVNYGQLAAQAKEEIESAKKQKEQYVKSTAEIELTKKQLDNQILEVEQTKKEYEKQHKELELALKEKESELINKSKELQDTIDRVKHKESELEAKLNKIRLAAQ